MCGGEGDFDVVEGEEEEGPPAKLDGEGGFAREVRDFYTSLLQK